MLLRLEDWQQERGRVGHPQGKAKVLGRSEVPRVGRRAHHDRRQQHHGGVEAEHGRDERGQQEDTEQQPVRVARG